MNKLEITQDMIGICKAKSKKNKWVYGFLYYKRNGKPFIVSEKFTKIPIMIDTICRSIQICDKNNQLIFENDIIKVHNNDSNTNDKSNSDIVGVVSYESDMCSFVILDYKHLKYYHIGNNMSEHLEIIGNQIDDYNY